MTDKKYYRIASLEKGGTGQGGSERRKPFQA